MRAEAEGFVVEVLARDGDSVEPGTPLVVLAEPALIARARHAARAAARPQGAPVRRDPAASRRRRATSSRISSARAPSSSAREQRIAQWTVRSKAAGRLVLAAGQDLPGSFVPKGTTLGYVLEAAPPLVRVVGARRARCAAARTHAAGRSPARGRGAQRARRGLRAKSPASTRVLPSAALGAPAGGPHAVDPADKEGTRALDPLFLFDVALERTALQRLGERAWVRFDLGAEPLAMQWQRRVRQALLKHFNPSS